ncbi:DUF2254 domain-containing protein [Halobacillus litoralis]|uniref:DUF2254 domain-containing protein n=1 Tax=Halobacillus litoralis TaxID=45668 RepID=A0A410M9P0_9BACI|nr:DUF2254 domain-containing protein [Halobacillus litoralis]QAS51449.1 DUF2254 domain-containing protein [Halobacillus litoralis]
MFDKLFRLLKEHNKKTPREKKLKFYANLWATPIIYTIAAISLFVLAVLADLQMNAGAHLPSAITVEFKLTQTILSTLTAGILSMTTFTFYGVLAALTTFSVQFSPRILKNFMMNTVTQRTLGIFIGSFHYVLLCLLFISKETSFFFIPIIATLLTMTSMVTFIVFINHIVTWLQVSNMTDDMKEESAIIAENLLVEEMDSYRIENPNSIKHQVPGADWESHSIMVEKSGYVQTIDFISLIKQAEKDDIVVRLEYKVGNYAFQSTPLIKYWKKNQNSIDESKYWAMVEIGRNQSEVQDIEYSLNKLVEIAIRAIGDNDPKTATRTAYQIGDLLIDISSMALFTPYLADDKGDLRLIIHNLVFRDYIYIGLASIRHYARKNVILTVEILKVLNAVAKVEEMNHKDAIWEFAEYTTRSLEVDFIHSLDREKLYYTLYSIAETTGYLDKYDKLVNRMVLRIEDDEDRDELMRKFPLDHENEN